MDWKDYVNRFSLEKESLDICFSRLGLHEFQPSTFTELNSKIIDDMLLLENDRLLFSFPENPDFVLSLALHRHINGILSGETQVSKVSLNIGDKIRLGDAVAEVLGFSSIEGEEYVKFGNKDDKKFRSNIWKVELLQYVVKAPDDAKVSSYPNIDKQASLISSQRHSSTSSTYGAPITDRLKQQKGAIVPLTLIISNTNGINDVINGLSINGVNLYDLISVARLKADGDLVSFGAAAMHPQIVIASNPDRAIQFVGCYSEKIGCVYVDLSGFPSLADYADSIGALSSHNELDAPLIFFKPTNSSLNVDSLRDLGFREFVWTPAMAAAQTKGESPDCLSPSISAFAGKSIRPFNVENPPIADLLDELLEIQNASLGEDENYNVTDAIAILIRFCFALSRQCAGFDPKVQSAMLAKGDSIISSLMSAEVLRYLDDKAKAVRLNEIWISIRKEILESCPLKKIELCGDLLNRDELENKDLCLIITDDSDVANTIEDIKSSLAPDQEPLLKFDVLTLSQFLCGEHHYDMAFICGWLGKEKMKQIILGNKAFAYAPLLYDFELEWMRPSISKWSGEIKQTDINGLIWDLNNESMPPYKLLLDESWFVSHDRAKKVDVGGNEYEDILNKVRDMQWHGYTKANPGEEKKPAKHVSFSDGSFGAFSSNYSFSRIPDDDEKTIESADINNLSTGDILLFGDSDHDILVEESNKLLASEGNGDALGYAGLWKSTISGAKMSGMSEEDIIEAFIKVGLNKSAALFRHWIDDECNIICPARVEDIEKIAVALNDDFLLEEAAEVYAHAKLVYSARIRTGRSLMRKLLEDMSIASAIASLRRNSEFLDAKVIVDIPGVGKVRVVAVSEIGEYEQYSVRIINQLRSFYG